MTYWAREHQQNLRVIGDLVRELDTMREETIPNLQRDLRDDDRDATWASRDRLAIATHHLAQAIHALATARDQLPEPRSAPSAGALPLGPESNPPVPSSVRASDLTAEEVMAREA